jgi:hypothetical protein
VRSATISHEGATSEPSGPSRPPDFVGVGAQKCGTSWWYSLLRQHPDVAKGRGRGKELHFFDDFYDAELTPERRDDYYRNFAVPEGQLVGEFTPRYLYLPWCPALLRQAAPDAKLLVILRDPTARTVSGVTRHLGLGRSATDLLVVEQIERSRYLPQLLRLTDHFPREQVLVLQYEALVADPERGLRSTHEFLGLEPRPLAADRLTRPTNPTTHAPWVAPASVRDVVRRDLHRDLEELQALCPGFDWTAWPTAG